MSLIARIVLIAAGIIASWVVARDALNFSAVQGVIVLVLVGLAVLAAALWPANWTERFNQLLKR